MGTVLENSLFFQDPEQFQELSRIAIQFNSLYNGNNIIQDDIFSVLVNYARKNGKQLELLRFPAKDDDFCALTCMKKGRIFVYINSWLPLSNQIFAAAHELYHIWCYIEEKDKSALRKGSFLNAAVMEESVESREEQKANAFAGILLAPPNALYEQMGIYRISKENPSMEELIRLMSIFSLPYKAMLLRLYEEGYIKLSKINQYLKIKETMWKRVVEEEPDAERWQRRTPEICHFGSLKQLMEQNKKLDLLTDSRIRTDQESFSQIIQRHGGGR